jgi:hypothetical protein
VGRLLYRQVHHDLQQRDHDLQLRQDRQQRQVRQLRQERQARQDRLRQHRNLRL